MTEAQKGLTNIWCTQTMVMHAGATKELLIGVKWYMNESDKKCYSQYVSEVPWPLPHILPSPTL